MKAKHLVFYDGECGFCDFCVRFILKRDKENLFVFAPLQGKTAENYLQVQSPIVQEADSLILIENFELEKRSTWLFGKAALRIAWHLGGLWALLGALSFLPGFFLDGAYKLVARNRKLILNKDACELPKQKDRKKFLP